MNCREIHIRLTEDLASRTEASIRAHLESCGPCRRFCQDLLELEDLSKSLSGRYRVPPGFQEAVLGRASRVRSRRYTRLVCALAVLVLAIAGGLLWCYSLDGLFVAPSKAEFQEPLRRLDGGFLPVDSPYVDVVVESADREDLILRLPSVIQIHRTELQEDFYINNVSH